MFVHNIETPASEEVSRRNPWALNLAYVSVMTRFHRRICLSRLPLAGKESQARPNSIRSLKWEMVHKSEGSAWFCFPLTSGTTIKVLLRYRRTPKFVIYKSTKAPYSRGTDGFVHALRCRRDQASG